MMGTRVTRERAGERLRTRDDLALEILKEWHRHGFSRNDPYGDLFGKTAITSFDVQTTAMGRQALMAAEVALQLLGR